MNKVGIIAEYNPFHNGHLYHLQNDDLRKTGDNLVLFLCLSLSCQPYIGPDKYRNYRHCDSNENHCTPA